MDIVMVVGVGALLGYAIYSYQNAPNASALVPYSGSAAIGGPAVNGTFVVQYTAQLPDGSTAYLISDGGYIKMVNTNGIGKYYQGDFTQFAAANWANYATAPPSQYVLSQ